MAFDKKDFETKLPPIFLPILDDLLKYGFIPTLVGGTVRDYLLTGVLGKDWDIELSHQTLSFEVGLWKELGRRLSAFGKINFLPYSVIRLEVKDFQFEFSPPRIEHFKEDITHHSNFEAEFDFKIPFEEAVKRRDFTINAMGIRCHSRKDFEFLDPLDGVRHLHEKVLHYAGSDFTKDPVRYLRAHRFGNRLKFSFSRELRLLLDSMDLDGLTPAYVWSEMKKSADPVQFLSYLVQEKETGLKLPLDKSLTARINEIRKIIVDPRRHETWIIALEWAGISSERWCKFFSLSPDNCQRLARWTTSSKHFQTVLPEKFQAEFEAVRDTQDFDKLFDWYFSTRHLLQKYPDLPLLKIVEDFLPDWIHLFRFSPLADVKHIDPPYRAKYQVWNLCQRI
jgi:tRNA nucleotidyltransferase/poly(A) polymerase